MSTESLRITLRCKIIAMARNKATTFGRPSLKSNDGVNAVARYQGGDWTIEYSAGLDSKVDYCEIFRYQPNHEQGNKTSTYHLWVDSDRVVDDTFEALVWRVKDPHNAPASIYRTIDVEELAFLLHMVENADWKPPIHTSEYLVQSALNKLLG